MRRRQVTPTNDWTTYLDAVETCDLALGRIEAVEMGEHLEPFMRDHEHTPTPRLVDRLS